MGCFVGSNSDLHSASIIAVMYAISCCIRPSYNGTRLYMELPLWRANPGPIYHLDCALIQDYYHGTRWLVNRLINETYMCIKNKDLIFRNHLFIRTWKSTSSLTISSKSIYSMKYKISQFYHPYTMIPKVTQKNYNDVTWASWCLISPVTPLFVQQLDHNMTKYFWTFDIQFLLNFSLNIVPHHLVYDKSALISAMFQC